MAEEDLKGQFHDTLLITEFIGSLPEVPTFKDVDIRELTDGEAKPVFVTLPIGKANVKSGNGRFYDEAFLQELNAQVIAGKPIGLMGHLASEQRGWAMPAEAVHWIGTLRVKEFLLGKGFLPPGESRMRLQRYKATGSRIATSIDATGDGVWDDTLQAHRMIASTLRLNQIDIAPADRAGIADLAAVPLLTREMATSSGIIVVRPIGEKKMTEEERAQMMREMKTTDISALPADVRAALINEYASGIRASLGLGEGDLTTEMKKLQERDAEREKAAVALKITEMATTGDTAIKSEIVREMVIDAVKDRAPKTVEEAATIFTEVVGRESVKKALQSQLQTTMGGNQQTTMQTQRADNAAPGMKGGWFVLPGTK